MDGLDRLLNYLDVGGDGGGDGGDVDLVDIEEWVSNKYYVGDIEIYPFWRDVIINFYRSNKSSIILTGSSRSGKTFVACILLMRKLYELSVYKRMYGDVCDKFKLDRNSNINFLILSATLESAENTTLSVLRRMVDSAPYFCDYFSRDVKKRSILCFDNDKVQVRAVSSYLRSLLGTNAICVMLDEMNFIGGALSGFRTALELYSEATSRISQTFNVGDGVNYGFKILISSANSSESFVETMIEKELKYNNAYVVRAARYKITPERFSDRKVCIFLGDKNFEPFFIDDEGKDRYKELLRYLGICEEGLGEFLEFEDMYSVRVPEAFRHLFEYIPVDFYNKSIDIYRIIKDVIGVSVGSVNSFFVNGEVIDRCMDERYKCVFNEEIEVSSGVEYNELLFNIKDNFFGESDKRYIVSVDLSKRYDCTGFCMGYYCNKSNKVIVPLVLRIKPPLNKKFSIKFKAIIEFIEYLKFKLGFNITDFLCDGYQSEYFIEHFSKMGLNCEKISVEGDREYLVFKDVILNNNIEMVRSEVLKKELMGLVHDVNKRRVDHLSDGSKDVADSVCRLVYKVLLKYDLLNSFGNKIVNIINRLRLKDEMGNIGKKVDDKGKKEVLDLINKQNGLGLYGSLDSFKGFNINKKKENFLNIRKI